MTKVGNEWEGSACVKTFDDSEAGANDVSMDGLGVCPPRSQTRPPKAPKERLVGRATSAVVAVAQKRQGIDYGNGVVQMGYGEGRRMVMRGLRRVLMRGCDEIGKGQAVEATLENPERSDLAGELRSPGEGLCTALTTRGGKSGSLQYFNVAAGVGQKAGT